jgi:RNA polymerase sigma-70 factor (ECF subfamily)
MLHIQMSATRTTTSLLDALHDPGNEPVWTALDARYRPVVAGMARRLGLNPSDAEEVAQESMAQFSKAYAEGRYDRSKGRLSSWIIGIAHHTALKMLRSKNRPAEGGGPDAADVGVPVDEHALRDIWNDERDRAILSRAMAMLRDQSGIDDRTILAFELVGIRGVPAEEAGAQCGMSVDQIYVAKSRVTRRLRNLVNELEAAYEEDA